MKELLRNKSLIKAVFSVYGLFMTGYSVFAYASGDSVQQNKVFVAQDRFLVIEAESVEITGEWQSETTYQGYSGTEYYIWQGEDYFGSAGHGILTYYFSIADAGTYQFKIHNYHGCSDHTLCNDVWVSLDGGSWIKTYSSAAGRWNWDTNHDFSEFNKPPASYNLTEGFHSIQFSGRSALFCLDRMVFHKDDVSEYAWSNAGQSEYIHVVDTTVPSSPGEISILKHYSDGYLFAWCPAQDNYRVKGYHIYKNNQKLNEQPIADSSFALRGLSHNTEYYFAVGTEDWVGNLSETRSGITVLTDFADTIPPTKPQIVTGTPADTSIQANWVACTDNYGVISGYNVYLDGTLIHTTSVTFFTIEGLLPGTEYTIGISSIDGAGNESEIKELVMQTSGVSNLLYYGRIDDPMVYPNPFSGQLNLLFPKPLGRHVIIQLTNMSGQLVFSKMAPARLSRIICDLAYLAPGAYFLQLSGPQINSRNIIFKSGQ